ncbi:MAG: hypothetical protein M3322_12660 [Actinomycetota bacterium]|nr:hypothetical protein [Actinomycetota bacterium]
MALLDRIRAWLGSERATEREREIEEAEELRRDPALREVIEEREELKASEPGLGTGGRSYQPEVRRDEFEE